MGRDVFFGGNKGLAVNSLSWRQDALFPEGRMGGAVHD